MLKRYIMDKKFLTMKEVAQLLKVSVNTIKNWTKENRIPHYKVGRRVLYEDREINSWLDEQKQAAVR
jgi:excisionase family DNA binding protein